MAEDLVRTPEAIAFGQARKLYQAEKYAEAAEAYTRALTGTNDRSIYSGRGFSYLRSGQFEKALADFKRCPDRQWGQAKALIGLGRYAEAVPLIKQHLKNDPDADAEDQAFLAEIMEKAGLRPPRGARPVAAPKLAEPSPIPSRKKGEAYDAFVSRLLEAAALGEHARTIEAARVPGVVFELGKGPGALGATRLGGLPDLPAKAKWPAHQGTPMEFVLQVRLDEVAPLLPSKALPPRGLLSFFVCEDRDHDDWLDAATVLFTDAKACAGLAPLALPKTFRRLSNGKKLAKPFGARALVASAVRKLPNPDGPELAGAKLHKDVVARYSGHVFEPSMAAFGGGRHQLLGVRDRSYAGDFAKGATLLLQVMTEPSLDMHWGDDDSLTFAAPRSGFSKGNFAKATVSCGD